ncbi:hypothetical protein KDA_40230 [Dictyobacter alpinus]|uniref:DUF304 domain-containing protein n=1 Tax=Dictyobacter alpinus TaxID=2014873 RepID=A0A402BB30_9CHLR|nr:hypothetical protein [Dictyobacter alpinus]GCE28539.1 hypothetical protein KDA_40230 [Dictyobacter alpinus]
MGQENRIILRREDEQVIATSHLGNPFAVYGISKKWIQFYVRMTYVVVFFAVIAIIFFMIIFVKAWYAMYINSQGYESLYSQISTGMVETIATFVPALLVSAFFWLLYIPQLKYKRLVLCENGLIYAEKKLRRKNVQAIYWKDVLGIAQQSSYSNAILSYMRDDDLTILILDSAFEYLDELIVNIREKSVKYK